MAISTIKEFGNMNIRNFIYLLVFVIFLSSIESIQAQIKGEAPRDIQDSVYIFNSPRPLINSSDIEKQIIGAWGFDLIFSGHGFGGGIFYERQISKNLNIFGIFHISGARNSDEFESEWDPNKQTYVVPNKINRLFMFPLIFGANYFVFTKELENTLKPYISFGLGPTFIISTPYKRDFFDAFGYSSSYTRFGSFLGIGADLSGSGKSVMSVNIKYYYIPFGGDGLESIKKLPIDNFGGIFLTLSIGMKF